MTLNKQIMFFISGLIFVLLILTFLLNVSNTKAFLQGQLVSNSEDSATTLALSLGSIADLENPAGMQAVIDAVFDRGQYALIALNDVDGDRIYARENNAFPQEVPMWFSHVVSIDLPSAHSMVQAGWLPFGELIVKAHSGYAYVELWRAMKRLFVLFLIASGFAVLLAYWMMKALLKPLKRIEEQANAIVKKEFVYQSTIPKTIEFQRVVVAMNDMVSKLKDIFERDAKAAEKLQRMAYQDTVTGLSNRNHFDMMLESYLAGNTSVEFGSLVVYRLDGLKTLNDRFGFAVGDHFMRSFSSVMSNHLDFQDGVYARLNGLELVALIPNCAVKDIEAAAVEVMNFLKTILKDMNLPEDILSISCIALGFKSQEKRGDLLSRVELAMLDMQAKPGVRFSVLGVNDQAGYTDLVWESLLEDAFAHQRFLLYKQDSFDKAGSVHDTELFVKMRDNEGVIRSAGFFMPAVAKAGLQLELDLVVIELALAHQKKLNTDTLLAINLNHKSLVDTHLFERLKGMLEKGRSYKLAFEFSDAWVSSDLSVTMPILDYFKSLGFEIGVDQFGSQFNNIQYLENVRPHYIKLDASFSKRVVSDEQTKSYVLSLSELAASLGIPVIAMAIEDQTQLDAFKSLGVEFFQGYFFGAPGPL